MRGSVGRVLEGENPGTVAAEDHGTWYREMFTPMVLLHGFIKKTRTTPAKELGLANRRMKEYVSNE